MKIHLWLFLVLMLAASGFNPCEAADTSPYVTNGDCDGFPQINLQTAPGLCVGLVANHLGFARGVAVVDSDIYVLDMGGWRKGHGRLLRLRQEGREAPEVLLDHLDEPNALIPAPEGALYVGLLGKVVRFDPATRSVKDIVINLPDNGKHPLPALAVAPDGSLFINVGSATDNCERDDDSAPDPDAPCPETILHPARGTIIHVTPQVSPVDARQIPPYASGLRYSMALTIAPSGQLYAAVNARDAINEADPSLSDEDLPHDTFDKIREDADYGWPYCYDKNEPSPEYPDYDCDERQLPTSLLPAHSAPLGMLFYKGDFLPGLKGELVMGYHGYRPAGHRIMTFKLSKNGVIQSPTEIVNGWDTKPGDHPQGAPVALFELEDGSILITEDQNGTLLRLSRSRE